MVAHSGSLPAAAARHAGSMQCLDTAACSTLDLVGQERFTLLARVQGAVWMGAAGAVSEALGITLPALMIGPGCEVADLYGDWERRCGIGETGCLLVRPDQHVAWRCESLGRDAEPSLTMPISTATSHCIARSSCGTAARISSTSVLSRRAYAGSKAS